LTLDQKIRDVLARLSTLSEAKASRQPERAVPSQVTGLKRGQMGQKQPTGHFESGIPAGVRLDLDPDRPPPKERSLFDFYVWHFSRADPEDHDRLLNLWLLAERDYHARALHIPRRVAVRSGEDAIGKLSGEAAEREAAKRVVELYEGRSAEEAAVFEYTTVQVIHKARKMHKRNLDDGRPRPPFRDWSEVERRRQIALLIAREKHQDRIIGAKAIAKHFGVDKNTVKRYLEPVAAAA
jgi:hypothetical protein